MEHLGVDVVVVPATLDRVLRQDVVDGSQLGLSELNVSGGEVLQVALLVTEDAMTLGSRRRPKDARDLR